MPRVVVRVGLARGVMALGMLGTGLAFVMMGRLVARVGSSRASFAIYVIPVVALILGAVFLDEAIQRDLACWASRW